MTTSDPTPIMFTTHSRPLENKNVVFPKTDRHADLYGAVERRRQAKKSLKTALALLRSSVFQDRFCSRPCTDALATDESPRVSQSLRS